MKASELIAELQKAVDEHGDMDILVRDCDDGYDWNGISVCPDPPSPMEKAEGVAGTIDINVFDDVEQLCGPRKICFVCESKDCRFNHSGECRFALVHERKPCINDADGCIDYDYQEGDG